VTGRVQPGLQTSNACEQASYLTCSQYLPSLIRACD